MISHLLWKVVYLHPFLYYSVVLENIILPNPSEIDLNELNLVSRNNEWGEKKKISNQINTTLNKNSEKYLPTKNTESIT